MKNDSSPRWCVVAVLCWVTVAVVPLACFQVYGCTWNRSASVPLGIYCATAPLERGGFVKGCLPEQLGLEARDAGYLRLARSSLNRCPGGVVPILKVVAAVGGDLVESDETGLQVNGSVVARYAPNSPLPVRPIFARVAPGELWLYGTHPSSWDSRYYSAVRLTDVVTVREVLQWR